MHKSSLLFIIILLSACTSTANEKIKYDNAVVASQVTKGITTKEQVRSLYGSPDHIISPHDGHDETWVYETTDPGDEVARLLLIGALMNHIDSRKNQAFFCFDTKDILQKFTVLTIF